MRRLLVVITLVLLGLVVGSAAVLEVDGGILQAFRFGVEVEHPSTCPPPRSVDPSLPAPPTTDMPTSEPCRDARPSPDD